MLNALNNTSKADHTEMEKQEFLANKIMQDKLNERTEKKRLLIFLDE